MADIAPTITVPDPPSYRSAVENIEAFANRFHIDIADGEFAPTVLVNPAELWWPEDKIADLHVMYQRPEEIISTLISLNPNMIVLHAESEGDLISMLETLKEMEIKTGIALLKETSVETAAGLIEMADHCLVFSGSLGHHGGEVDFELLNKVKAIRELKPGIEIGWDGGINSQNASGLVDGGVNVLNVGGFIQHSDDPRSAYQEIVKSLKQ